MSKEYGETKITTIRQLKTGKFFRIKDSKTAPVWVRDEYIPPTRKFSTHRYDDMNHETLRKGDFVVFTGFTF